MHPILLNRLAALLHDRGHLHIVPCHLFPQIDPKGRPAPATSRSHTRSPAVRARAVRAAMPTYGRRSGERGGARIKVGRDVDDGFVAVVIIRMGYQWKLRMG